MYEAVEQQPPCRQASKSPGYWGHVSVVWRPGEVSLSELRLEPLPISADEVMMLSEGISTHARSRCYERTVRFIEPEHSRVVQQQQRFLATPKGVFVVTYTDLATRFQEGVAEADQMFHSLCESAH